MDHYLWPLCPDHKYCSVAPSLRSHSCHGLVAHAEPVCGCSLPAHPCVTHHAIPPSCLWTSHHLPLSQVSCRKVDIRSPLSCLSSLSIHETVLARRQPDGFYYLATVRQEEEPGVYLIEFNKPCAEGGRFQSTLQKTRAGDIIQYRDALRHCIVPGDNVMAPWERDLIRYGPGTVTLGLETRDPLRASEDEELTVSFWNGKKTQVPLGIAVWISPSAHRRIVDALHSPIGSGQTYPGRDQSSTTYVISDRFTTVPVCSTDHFHSHKWHHHVAHPHYTHQHCSCCCYPSHSRCTCCFDPKCQNWWPLSPTTTVYVEGRKGEEDDQETFSAPKGRTSPKYEHVSRSSVSSESEDDTSLDDENSESETWLSRATQSTMVDSAVNTDSSLWERPRTDVTNRPEWRYWKHNQPEPYHRKPGSSVSITKHKNKASKSDVRASLPDPSGLSNQSSLFETIGDSPANRLTVKDVLIHKDFNPSNRQQSPPVLERLGESEVVKLRQKQAVLEQQQKNKIQYHQWERSREQRAEQKYSDIQETNRKKMLQRLQNEELKMKEQETRNSKNINAKKEAREKNSLRIQTLAAEDKQKEQCRLDHLRSVREKIDQKEFEKCAANEQKEINNTDARRRRVENHYRQVAEKVYQAEQQRDPRVAGHRPQKIHN